MYCPNDECPDFLEDGIRGEYREDVETCPKCGARLAHGEVPSTTPPVEELEDPLVAVAVYDQEHKADLAVSFLRSMGIEASVSADDCGRTDPALGFVTGGLRVVVRESQAREAAELLASQAPVEDSDGA